MPCPSFIFLHQSKKTLEERRGRRKSINLAIVTANNHYAGFGPGTANIFRKIVGLQEVTWSKEENKKEGALVNYHKNRDCFPGSKIVDVCVW
jgi:hypothetical protein